MRSSGLRTTLLVLATIFNHESVDAFLPNRHHCGAKATISFSRLKALSAIINENSKSDNASSVRERKRRDVVGTWLRKAFVVGLGYKTVSTASASPAIAAVDDAVNGRIVSFQVQNLNGVEGQTGTIKIQLAPSWAPRGVARFEVRLNICFQRRSATIVMTSKYSSRSNECHFAYIRN